MDAADILRQGLGSVIPRPPQIRHPYPRRPPVPPHLASRQLGNRVDVPDDDASSHRIAHTLTACCRCRQRKTRCDPALPRCLPCERSNSTCEYFDTIKGKKISRHYVVKLQDKVRRLEAELAAYTEEDGDYPRNHEDMVRPGGLVRLDETDETPRYLGPSSGIAMARLLMEEAKSYTDSKRISELIPELRLRRAERRDRMQSIVSTSQGRSLSAAGGRKNYPMLSQVPAQNFPTSQIMQKLVEIFNDRAQLFSPVLHERNFARDVEAVYKGDKDAYRLFVVRMVIAISLQKLDATYAGLADSYYLAAMTSFEEVIRPKDLKTLQCLILIGEYSLLTPTRTATYHIVGLAVRICQQLGLGEEKTIGIGIADPQVLDMRRRLGWIVTSTELNLSCVMGRPNGFAKGDDCMNVDFFATVSDDLITEEGIRPGPPCEKKLVAIHLWKMRIHQAEIRRTLYESKPDRPQPQHDSDPWFAQMEQKLDDWRDSAPTRPEWCKNWFRGHYHNMVEFLYRPSPQVPKPTDRAALRCFASSSFIVKLSSQQIKTAAVDVTWVFVLTLYSALNTLLWTLSYPDVRAAHTREEVMELVGIATDVVEQCSHRWPGSTPASQLYLVLAKACMQSYDLKRDAPAGLDTPSTMITSSPSTPASSTAGAMSSTTTTTQQAQHLFNTQFGYVFDASQAPPYGFSPTEAIEHNKIAHPTFRSNSIFLHPATNMHDRRASSFPPDFPEQKFKPSSEAHALDESTPPATQTPHGDSASPPAPSPFLSQTSPPVMEPGFDTLPTPPDTLEPAPSFLPDVQGLSPTPTVTTLKASSPPPPITQELSPVSLGLHSSPLQAPQPKFEPGFIDSALPNQLLLQQQQQQQQRCLQTVKQEASMLPPPSTTRSTGFTIPPPQPQAQLSSQRPLPQGTTVTNWFNPAPPFISPYANFPPPSNGMNGTAGGYWGNDDSAVTTSRAAAGGTLSASTSASAASLYNAAGLGLGHVNNFPSGSGRGDGLGPAQLPPGMTPDGYGLYRGGIDGMQFAYDTPLGRHGSLSQEQQMELMQVLETEGMGDINNYLTMGMGLGADPAGASGWR